MQKRVLHGFTGFLRHFRQKPLHRRQRGAKYLFRLYILKVITNTGVYQMALGIKFGDDDDDEWDGDDEE